MSSFLKGLAVADCTRVFESINGIAKDGGSSWVGDRGFPLEVAAIPALATISQLVEG
jgi:hypothetical protein